MTRATTPFVSLQVTAASGGGGGTLPAAGAAKLIEPAGWHQAKRITSAYTEGQWTAALFQAYGSGTFNPSYSTDGAYVIAGSGGHFHTEIRGAVAYNFTTRTADYVAPVGIAETGDPYAYSNTDLNAAPWREFLTPATGATNSRATAANGTTIPAIPHPYRNLTYIPTSNGGGTKGSMMYVGRAALTDGNTGSTTAHKFDCATGVWSRAAPTAGSFPFWPEATSIFDSVSNRYYVVLGNIHDYSQTHYLKGSDWTWGATPNYPWPTVGTGTYAHAGLYVGNGKRLILHFYGTRVAALDLTNETTLASGFQTLQHTGPAPTISQNHGWVNHTAKNAMYSRTSSGAGQTLYRFTPPADPAALLTGQWTFSTLTLTGDTIPEFMGAGVTTDHYQSLFYIPTLQMLGWVTAFGIALLNP